MKKLLVVVATFAIMLSACEGPEGPMGPRGEQGEPGVGDWYVTSFTVNSNAWVLEGNPEDIDSYYYYEKTIPQLSQAIFDEGLVIGYMRTANNAKNEMPYVMHLGSGAAGSEYFWTQTYDFGFKPGKITLYVTYSDFATSIRPDTETFYFVLLY